LVKAIDYQEFTNVEQQQNKKTL